MAETAHYAGSLVGFESDAYEARVDPATGEVIPARDVYRVWVSAKEGAGAPVRVTVSLDQYKQLEVAGFGAELTMVVRLGAYRDAITRRCERYEVIAPEAPASPSDAV